MTDQSPIITGMTNIRAFEIVMELAQQAVADPHEDPDEAKMQDEAIELVASLRTYAQELDSATLIPADSWNGKRGFTHMPANDLD